MLELGNRFPQRQAPSEGDIGAGKTLEYTCLEQDYWGILCHVLLKKRLIGTIEDFFLKIE